MYVVEEANKNLKLTEILEELQKKGGNRKKYLLEHFSESIQRSDQLIVISKRTHFEQTIKPTNRTDIKAANIYTEKA